MLVLWLLNPLIFLLAIWVYRYMKQTYSTLERLNIPGPKPIWVFGNALDFKDKDTLDVFLQWKKTFGKVYGFFEGFRASIVVNDPELSKQILSKHFDKFDIRTPYLPFTYYPGTFGLLTSSGLDWRRQRAVISKTLNYTCSIKQMLQTVDGVADKLMTSLEHNRMTSQDGFYVTGHLHRFTVDTNARVVLGFDEGCTENDLDDLLNYAEVFRHSASADNPITGLARLFPSLTPFLKLFDSEHRNLYNKTAATLTRRLSKLQAEKQQNNNSTLKDVDSVASHLLGSTITSEDSAGNLGKRHLTEEEVMVALLQMFSETFQTILNCMSFMVYELANHPEAQENIYQEISQLFNDKSEDFEQSTLQSMEYFDMFLNETIRMHPIAPGVARTCSEDCTIDGIQFKAGMVIRLMVSPLYVDEAIYPEPEVFKPERFSKEEQAKRHQYSFVPFGHGPRACPGYKLALLQIKIVFIRILQKYKIQRSHLTEKAPLKTALRPSLCPANDVHIQLVLRV